jgi:hypothetical protein
MSKGRENKTREKIENKGGKVKPIVVLSYMQHPLFSIPLIGLVHSLCSVPVPLHRVFSNLKVPPNYILLHGICVTLKKLN